jgi:hypothetical protein
MRAIAGALARRPHLWPTAAGQVLRLAAPGWWRRAPFLPLPTPEYLRFRMVTQYGDADHQPEPSDVVSYLEWCRFAHRNSLVHG